MGGAAGDGGRGLATRARRPACAALGGGTLVAEPAGWRAGSPPHPPEGPPRPALAACPHRFHRRGPFARTARGSGRALSVALHARLHGIARGRVAPVSAVA